MPSQPRLLTTPITDALVRGAVELEATPRGVQPHRLPSWARAQAADAQLAMAEAQPAGVRLELRTTATSIELAATATRVGYRGVPPRPFGVFDLVVDGRPAGSASLTTATTVTIDMATGTVDTVPGGIGSVIYDGLPAGPKHVELWLPHNESVELVELRTDAPVEPIEQRRPIWVHHGSSISHGSNAEHPTGTWPVIAASLGGVDLVNLGFSGSALLDPFTARTIRDLPADLLSVKLGINLVGADLMRRRAFGPAVHGFLDTIRDGHPDVPLYVISPILCPIHEETPGPGAFDLDALAQGRVQFRATGDPAEVATGKLTLGVVRDELARIVQQRAATDPQLHHLDGLALYGPADAEELPLPDRLHPDAATHRRIGERFAALAFEPGGPFTARTPSGP